MSTTVEKAFRQLGIIVFKRLAANPDVPDYDDEIIDEPSMEAAFYEFMTNPRTNQ